jgi:hypothetical protein
MKTKLPTKITLCGIDVEISYTSKHGGGNFNLSSGKIEIGTKNKKHIPVILLHEVIEAVLTERDLRWRLYSESAEKMIFNFNHNEFENACKDIAGALKPFLIGELEK